MSTFSGQHCADLFVIVMSRKGTVLKKWISQILKYARLLKPYKRPPKALKTKLLMGGPSGSSLLRSDGSCEGQAGGWTAWEVSKDAQGRLGNLFEKNKGPSQKTGTVTAYKKGSTYSFSRLDKERWCCCDEDDDAVRTSESQDWATVTLCTEELFLSISIHI